MTKDKEKNNKPAAADIKKVSILSKTIQLYMAITLFAIAVVMSRGADMTGWEVSVFDFFYHRPAIIRPLMFVVTQMGSVHVLGLLLIVLLVLKKYAVLYRLLATSFLSYLIVGFAKDMWGRPRPLEILSDVVSLDYEFRGPGFPSGHTAVAVAMALVLYHYLPRRFKFIAPLWIIGVAISRMYVGVHAPLDILGGFAIGWFAYALVMHLDILNIKRSKAKKSLSIDQL